MPTKKSGRQNYDWNMIMMDYVTDPKATLRSIAAKYGIRQRTVYDQSRDNAWLATKRKYQKDVTAKATAKAATTDANKLAKELECVNEMQKRIETMLKDTEQFQRHIVTESAPAPEGIGVVSVTYDKVLDKTDVRAMKDTLQCLHMIEDMKRSMMNIRKAEELDKAKREWERVRIEQERLEMDKARADYQKPDKDVHISIGGFEEGWAD